MPTQPQDPDLADIVIGLARRLTALEHAGPLQNASATEAGIVFYDAAGVARVTVGLLPSGSYGIRILNANGTLAFEEVGT